MRAKQFHFLIPHTSWRQCKLRAPLDFYEEAYGAGQKEDC